MPRAPRLVVPEIPMHVIQRGNNRSRMFTDADDYRWFRRALCTISRSSRCAIHAYVLMPNHVHLLLTPTDRVGPSRMMQRVGRAYVRYFNDRHARTGTLWEGRFRSSLVDSDQYFFTCSRYIEMNPLRAAMVEDPGEFRWSSYRANALGTRDPMLTPHYLYDGLHATAAQRIAAYRGMFNTRLDARVLDAIRKAARSSTPLGDDEFRNAMNAKRSRGARGGHGGDRRSSSFRTRTWGTRL